MKTFHILTYLFGDQYSKYALVEINASVICAITAARRTIAAFSGNHGGHTALDHHGCLTVHLLSDIPESLMETHGDCVAESLFIADLDIAALLAEAREAGLTLEATDTGIVIGPQSVCLVAHEEDWELELSSADFLKFIKPYLPEPLTDSPWTSDEEHPVQDWQAEVAAGDTRLGYQAWIDGKRDEEPSGDRFTKFTVWCQQSDGRGTIYISSVKAKDPEEAARLIIKECADSWEESDLSKIHCLGVATGNVQIIEWNDIDG